MIYKYGIYFFQDIQGKACIKLEMGYLERTQVIFCSKTTQSFGSSLLKAKCINMISFMILIIH